MVCFNREDLALTGSVAGNDSLSGDGGNVFSIKTNPANGTLTMNDAGAFTYTPDANYHGSDSFAYQLTDADGDFDTATVSVTVAAIPSKVTAISGVTLVAEMTIESPPNGDPVAGPREIRSGGAL